LSDCPVTTLRRRGRVIERLPIPRRALIAHGTRRIVMSRKPCVGHTPFLLASVRFTLVLALVSLCLAAAGALGEESEKKEEKTVVEAGSTVRIEYTLTLEDGTKVDSNVGGEALRFEQGSGQIIPGLDKGLIGMKVGEAKQVKVTPDEGYGQVNPAAFTEVPVSELPEDGRVPGMMLVAQDAQGRTQRLRVQKIEGDTATLDFNHPLAGKTLIFDVKILEVQ
jgi:FKBP-type peptidyl-prolyl cis-trans isomerase SlyD